MAGAIVLMYHRIGDGVLPGREPGEELYAVPAAAFAAQLDAVARAGCSVLGLDRAAAARGDGSDLPPRSVVLTFDDGNLSDHDEALPAIAARGWTATFFVSPALIGSHGYLGWSDLAALHRAGMIVGAHGWDHRPLTALADAELAAQMTRARDALGERLGTAPRFMSLPGGQGDERVHRAARAAGFEVVAGSVPRRLAPGGHQGFLPRFAVRRRDSVGAVSRLVGQDRLTLLRHAARHHALGWLRKGLGERLYQGARKGWARSGAQR